VTLRFGSSHSRVKTIARVAGLSEYKTRKAIRELERRGLLSHRRRNTWHGRGANDYRVKPPRR
jgi:predicted DNA-binding transcriptional regulator